VVNEKETPGGFHKERPMDAGRFCCAWIQSVSLQPTVFDAAATVQLRKSFLGENVLGTCPV
jgi:hypothetical protein